MAPLVKKPEDFRSTRSLAKLVQVEPKPNHDHLFEDQVFALEIPNTAKIKACKDCHRLKNRRACQSCEGTGHFRMYRRLLVTWSTMSDFFIIDKSGLPLNKITKARGHELFNITSPKVEPIESIENVDLLMIDSMNNLINKHDDVRDKKIYQQRHLLKSVQITKVTFSKSHRVSHFFIYGLKSRIYYEESRFRCLIL